MTSSTKCHHSHFLDIIFICYFIFQCNSCRFLIPQTQHADKSKHRLSLVTPLVTISTYTEVVAATLFFLDISATAVSGNCKGQVSFDLFLVTGFPIFMSFSIKFAFMLFIGSSLSSSSFPAKLEASSEFLLELVLNRFSRN